MDYRVQKLEEGIKSLTRRIETPQAQAVMAGMGPKAIQAPLAVQQWKEERSKLQEELQEVRTAREVLRTTQDIPFVWDIAFVEIFQGEKKGFDIVVGNPPYVRQENIEDPQEVYDKATYKAKLQQSVYAAYPTFFGYNMVRNTLARKIDGRSDYYVFFYLHGLKLLNDKGSFCFITSNSWLDVGYGRDLQEFLLKHCHIKMILDNEKKRSFAQADINTVIALFSAPNNKSQWSLEKQARFIMFRVPFEHILSPVIFDEIEEVGKPIMGDVQRQLKVPVFGMDEMLTLIELSRPEFKARVIRQGDLYKDGCGPPEEENNKLVSTGASYPGGKWGGKYIRAPEIFWTILEKGKNLAHPLSEYFVGERYLNTGGADGFFILTNVTKSSRGFCHVFNNALIKPSGKPFDGEIEEHYLVPLIKDFTKYDKRAEIHGFDAYCLVVSGRPSSIVKKYIEWGQAQGYHRRSVTKSQKPWYKPTRQMTGAAKVLVPRSFNDSFVIYHNPQLFLSLRFYRLHCKKGHEVRLVAFLNSTLVAFIFETLGNRSLGQGVLDFFMADFLALNIPVVEDSKLEDTFKQLKDRPARSIWEEFGLPKPNNDYSNIHSEDVSLDRVLPDRRALDKVVFEALGMTKAEQLEVYRAVVELVKNRSVKAGSV